MPHFHYTTLENGVRQTGIVAAASQSDAAAQLRRDRKTIVAMRPAKENECRDNGGNSACDFIHGLLIPKSAIELALRQLAALLKAGVPILTAIRSIAEHTHPALRKRLDKVTESVRQGNALSVSLQRNLPQAGRVTLGLLTVGESNGTIDQMASYAADLMERSRKIKSQMTQAFAYPVAVMLASMGIGYYMVNKVFPVIMKFLEKSRSSVTLPLPTRMVIWLNDFLTGYGILLVLAPLLIGVLFLLLRRKMNTGELVDRFTLKIPMIGGALIFHANTMWCLTLGALMRSGLDVVSAVELVERTMGNWHYALQFQKIRQLLRNGTNLGRCLGETTLKRLSPMAYTMVSVSEESGGMDQSLMHVAEYSEEQLNRRVAMLSKMVEPAIFVIVGGFVGLVYFGFFMAMLTATKAAR